jgi:hypothetical protein
LYPSTVLKSKPLLFDPNYHTGGKWRERMGKGYTNIEVEKINKALEELRLLLKQSTSKSKQ